jgi:hypothetical protein
VELHDCLVSGKQFILQMRVFILVDAAHLLDVGLKELDLLHEILIGVFFVA